MLDNSLKKPVRLLTALLFCIITIATFSFSGFAVNGVEMRLAKLEKEFPDGWYYNHKVNTQADTCESLLESRNEAYAKSVSRYPCMDHNDTAEIGVYDCNFFDSGYQCHGFASMLFYEIFGQRQSSLKKQTEGPFNLRAGDLVRLKNDTHSAIVLKVNGDSFTVAECNVGMNGEPACCNIVWGRKYSVSEITYCIRAENYKKISADTSWKNIEEKTDAGKAFYAAIHNGDKVLTLKGKSSLTFRSYTGSASQVWEFRRQANGSYKIINRKNKKALTAFKDSDGKLKVGLSSVKDSKGQLWAFYKKGSKYLLSADISLSVLASDSKANAVLSKKSSSEAVLFTVKKKKTPEASVIKAKGANNAVTLSWTKGENTKSFDVNIYDATSKLYKKYEDLTKTSLKVKLPVGNYSAEIISRNPYSEKTGNRVYFTVAKKGELGKTAKVTANASKTTIGLSWTPVTGADGYAVFVKSKGSWKKLGTTKKTSYTVKKLSEGKKYTFAIRACKLKNGKVSLAKSYTSFTAATKIRRPSTLSASQTSSTVTLSWSAVKNADGYRVYRKTSSGWTAVASTTKNLLSAKKLSSGKNYTFGVKAGIKTDVGTVWSDVKSIRTSTAPKAPKLTVSDVNNLKATIRWDKVNGADGYQVYYKVNDAQSYTHLANYLATDVGVTLSGLSRGGVYTFAVRAYKKLGDDIIYGSYKTVKITAKY